MEEIERCTILCANCHQIEHLSDKPVRKGREKLDPGQYLRKIANDEGVGGEADRQATLRGWAFEYKGASDGCVRCGEDDARCLEFHHVDEEEKTGTIAKLISQRVRIDRLLDEVNKCVIICRNCHRKLHYVIPEKVTD